MTRANGAVVATGRANAKGVFTFSTKGLPKGKVKLVAVGKTATRTGQSKVSIG